MSQHTKPAGILLLLAILLLSLNLRPAIAAIGPLVQSISQFAGVKSVGISLLTSIPVLMMGLGAIYAGRIRQALGERGGIAIGGAVIAIACLMRLWTDNSYGLFTSAALVGLGIAVILRRYCRASSSAISAPVPAASSHGTPPASWWEPPLVPVPLPGSKTSSAGCPPWPAGRCRP
ncbi:hypothetical protein QU487_16600 [Crenobacter sp. SG2305]|uniref:hypothetical protein n=1 Tax=Crenobacter oryzisoli TaxID=3056844 RepID=UPI0025AA8A93|nr:hypothetical protein [Crenobacter sp. SG2305]MDN0084361.1 hypothetical protein [Crenobacter sp. SG2305]